MKYASSLFVAALLVVGATAAHAENTVCKTVKTGDCHRTIDGTETCTPVFKEVCLPFVPDTSDDPHAGMTRRQIDREDAWTASIPAASTTRAASLSPRAPSTARSRPAASATAASTAARAAAPCSAKSACPSSPTIDDPRGGGSSAASLSTFRLTPWKNG